MGLIQEEDEKRYFNHLALQGVETFLSEQTSFIQDQDKIPLYENFCAALALCASKQKENAEKAHALLTHLFSFQVKEGSFPRYLHEYPFVRYDYVQLDIYFVLWELAHTHSQALGNWLSGQIKKVAKKLLDSIEKNLDIELVDQRTLFKCRLAKFLNDNSIVYLPLPSFKQSSKQLGELLLSVRLTKEYLELVKQYVSYWHPSLMCYTGPCIDEYYEKEKISLSVFDYIMSSFYKVYPERFKDKALLQLEGALIKSQEGKREGFLKEIKGDYKNMSFKIFNEEDFSLFAFEKYEELSEESRGFHLMRMIWKSEGVNHHLVCQSKGIAMHSSFDNNEFSSVFTYPILMPEDLSKLTELEFFVDRDRALTYRVNGKQATLFSLNDHLEIHSKDKKIELIFSLEEGKGEVTGHFSFGNRPAQLDKNASKELEAFDTRIQLRTLRRTSDFRIKLVMKVSKKFSSDQILDYLQRLPLHEDHCQHT